MAKVWGNMPDKYLDTTNNDIDTFKYGDFDWGWILRKFNGALGGLLRALQDYTDIKTMPCKKWCCQTSDIMIKYPT